jgi:hypothetical protein
MLKFNLLSFTNGPKKGKLDVGRLVCSLRNINGFSRALDVPHKGLTLCCGSGSGMGNKSGSGSGMNKPDHISESLEIIFWVKILKFFDSDL